MITAYINRGIADWLSADEARLQMSNTAWELISHNGSLTQHLRQITRNKIQHRLLLANWGQATPTERQALQLAADERTWIRQIEWRCLGALWVHARAVFPETTIKQTQETIPGLGVQSLGEVIFKDPNLK